jgi:hypothetical protein
MKIETGSFIKNIKQKPLALLVFEGYQGKNHTLQPPSSVAE